MGKKANKMMVSVRNGLAFWGGNKPGKKLKKKTRWIEKETGVPAREIHKRESGIKTSTKSLLINDMHYVMCRLV